MAKNWAIAIGINHYNHLQDLKYAKHDAKQIETFLTQEAGFDRVWLFSEDANDPKWHPNKDNIKYSLPELLQGGNLGAGDNLWFFFSGHGVLHNGRDYLMPCTGDPNHIEDSAIALSYIIDVLRYCGADNLVLILDACRSEGIRSGLGIGEQTAQKSRQSGVISFFSCSPTEYSYEIEELRQGAFTKAFLEGLLIEGKSTTVERLDHYLVQRVPELNRQYGQTLQTPQTVAEPISQSHLILLERYAKQEDINQLKLDAYRAEQDRNWKLAEELWFRVNIASSGGDWEVIQAFQLIALAKSQQLKVFSFEVVTVDNKGQETARRKGEATYFEEDLGNGVTLEMVYIPGGTFMMGSPEREGTYLEKPQHPVSVSPFFMGKYPVTQAQWRRVAKLPKVKHDLHPELSYFRGKNLPVERVSWYEAVEFTARLAQKTGKSYRLPSEAEWEYACRAGTTTPFHFGETITTDLANYRGNSPYAEESKGIYREKTTPVGSFKVANAFGLFDMHGNVWEWCLDDWHGYYEGAPDDGSAWFEKDWIFYNHPFPRGGSWLNNSDSCRSAFREPFMISKHDNYNNIGLRVVCETDGTFNF